MDIADKLAPQVSDRAAPASSGTSGKTGKPRWKMPWQRGKAKAADAAQSAPITGQSDAPAPEADRVDVVGASELIESVVKIAFYIFASEVQHVAQ